MDTTQALLPLPSGLVCEPLLPSIAAQAVEADRTRDVSRAVIDAIKASDLIRLSATPEIGGLGASVTAIAHEFEAVAAACGSTAWCLWNHLCVFHYYVMTLGPDGADTLRGIVRAREWVTYPNGAGSGVTGTLDGDEYVLNGKITFASGARYGEWALVMFREQREAAEPSLHFTVVRLDAPGVSIAATWDGMSVRASATDDVHFAGVRTPASLVRPFERDYVARIRRPEVPVVAHRYREDWVGLAVLWLAAQSVGAGAAALEEAVDEAATRRAIFGLKMAERPGVQFNLGEAAALLAAARATCLAGCNETDARIDSGAIPTEADYLRQLNYAMVSLRLSGEAFQLMLRTLGGNGLRESGSFERRFRDYQAAALHITAHPDRVREMTGRWLLGVDQAETLTT